MKVRNVLICTVGTSLFSNLLKLDGDGDSKNRALITAFHSQNWKGVARELLNYDPLARVCGAEINTIHEAQKKKWLSINRIHFLVSDTEPGKRTGEVLKLYFQNRKDLNLGTNDIEIHVIDKLQDENPSEFRRHGLRNLVKKVGEIVQRYGGPDTVALDSTGGYKAQIAVAVLIGQALNMPVYYKHEKFSEIIEFPPLPVSLDYDILGENADLLTDFEKGRILTKDEVGNLDQKLMVFLNELNDKETTLYELNALGQIYLTSFRLRFPKVLKLVELENKDRSHPTFGNDHHYPHGFMMFVNKVWEENKWIKTCYTLPYFGQRSIKGIGFKVKQLDGKKQLIGYYRDKGFGARFVIRISEESIEALNWAALRLNDMYKND